MPGWGAPLAASTDANRFGPLLRAYDRGGYRIDQVEFHPSQALPMSGVMQRGLHWRPWAQPRPGAMRPTPRAFTCGHMEAGTLCLITMTHAANALVAREPEGAIDYAHDWLPRLMYRGFDGADAPLRAKCDVLLGMGLTEKQGSSDLRAITTQARPLGPAVSLVGHKWFFRCRG